MMMLSEAASIVEGQFIGADALFTAVTTDSRLINPGDLFVAIPGENQNGHEFISQAQGKDAAGAMVSEPVNSDMAQIKVVDTTAAMGKLASQWRSRFNIPVLAITGSNGKTTITKLAASILGRCGQCLAPEKSFNNQWGVPLTLLKLNDDHDFAVIEMGTNHEGEIAYLSQLTKPNFALISNISPAHLQGLESLENIAQAKAEIYSGLSENDCAVFNVDDPFGKQFMDQVKSRLKNSQLITFGIQHQADVSASNIESQWLGSRFKLRIVDQSVEINLPLPGMHNVSNALAAAAICHGAGVSVQAIKDGLENSQPVPGRLIVMNGLCGSTVVDDSYNANPQSLKAGIDMLSNYDGVKILVLGAMAELGGASRQLHFEIGEYAKQEGVNAIFCLAEQEILDVQCYADGYGNNASVYENIDQLFLNLKNHLKKGVAVLVKGSRSAKMERVVEKITIDGEIGNNNNNHGSDYMGGATSC